MTRTDDSAPALRDEHLCAVRAACTARAAASTQPRAVSLLLAALALSGCGAFGGGDAHGESSGPRFTDVAQDAGIRFRHTFGTERPINLLMTTGAGAAFFDYDRDGWLDAFLVNGTRLDEPADKGSGAPLPGLFHNEGDGTFTDVTRAAGFVESTFGQGCAIGDFDGDGFDDLYLTNFGPNRLYRNRGDGTFEDVTTTAGVGDARWSTGAVFVDYDGDGDLDLYVSNYARLPDGFDPTQAVYKGPLAYEPDDDVLYRNEGDGTFADVTAEVGLMPGGRGLTVFAADLDGDGDEEIFVANDLTRNWLYRNDGGGQLTEVGNEAGVAVDPNGEHTSAMGVDIADVDGDGRPDIHVTNFHQQFNNFYRNLGDLVFRDETHRFGLDVATFDRIGWATRFADFDLDGRIDCFVANGGIWAAAHGETGPLPYEERNLLFRGQEDGRFVESSATSGAGFTEDHSTRGAAFGDYDHDGDLDILLNNANGPAQLLRNDTNPGDRWLAVRFVGRAPNTAAIGAHATLTIGSRTVAYEVQRASTYLSSSPPELRIALGPGEDEGALDVTWPGGARTTAAVQGGRVNVVEEPAP